METTTRTGTTVTPKQEKEKENEVVNKYVRKKLRKKAASIRQPVDYQSEGSNPSWVLVGSLGLLFLYQLGDRRPSTDLLLACQSFKHGRRDVERVLFCVASMCDNLLMTC